LGHKGRQQPTDLPERRRKVVREFPRGSLHGEREKISSIQKGGVQSKPTGTGRGKGYLKRGYL